ncbi:MAG: hypothetical protein AMJ66_00275 [Betaproteobacteria bacterium SG8_40]|nr:MAG: hypothetical protein AMJ66_00275 [Betaproteobacteria bacterium SG8_40]
MNLSGQILRSIRFGSLVLLALAPLPVLSAAAQPAEEKPAAGTGMYSTYVDKRSSYFSDELGKTAPIAMEDLLAELLIAIDRLSKYKVPDEAPPIHRVPHETIEQLTCGAECAALAVYRAGEGIYLDEALQPETNIFARSVLLHELVHYVQDASNELAEARPCERWYRREQEAYALQKVFLMLAGSQIRVAYSAGSTCEQDG